MTSLPGLRVVKPPAGPPWSVTDGNERFQRLLPVWPPYTICRRASNNDTGVAEPS